MSLTKKFQHISALALFGFCFIFLVTQNLRAQSHHIIDSLETELSKAKEDSTKTILYYRIWQQYRHTDLAKAEAYARIGLQHANKIKWPKGQVAFYTSMGETHENINNEDSVTYYYEKGIEIAKAHGISRSLSGLYINLSSFYGNRANYVTAIDYGFKGLDLALSVNDTNYVLLNYSNIGKFYYAQENIPKTKEYQLKALQWLGNPDSKEITVGQLYHTLALSYFAEYDTAAGLQYLAKAKCIAEYNEDLLFQAEIYSNYAQLEKDIDKKFSYAFQAKALFDTIQLPYHIMAINNLKNIGQFYLDLVKNPTASPPKNTKHIPATNAAVLQKAENYFLKALGYSKETANAEYIAQLYRLLGELEEARHQPTQALRYYKESYRLSDSLFSQENKNRIAELESQRIIDERDQQIAVNKLELKNAKRTRIALLAGAILLFIIGTLLFYQNRIRQHNNQKLQQLNQELENANRIKTQFFGILSHDLRKPVSNLLHFLHLQTEAPELIRSSTEQQHNIQSATENLLDTLESMLLWSKSQMERFQPQKKNIPINHFVQYLQKSFANEQPIHYQINIPPHTSLFTDEDYFKTILYNLTANALKALSQTPNPQITWQFTQQNHEIIIALQDNGPGMSTAQQDVLHNANTPIAGKHGLGLHIIRDLALAIHCRIKVSSKPGNGTTISLYPSQQ